MRWFGHPWPSEIRRAPVCEDDADHVDLPTGARCCYCEKWIGPNDQGVVMAASAGVRHSFEMILGARRHIIVAQHLDCLLYQVLGYRRMPQ